MISLTFQEMFLRLSLSLVLGGVIGYERELKGRDAGLRTHILVTMGAAIVTLTQLEATKQLLVYSLENPETIGIVSTDIMRMTSQIVSGIGFLGAGTIIVSNRSVIGLTTAASIWTVAGIGIATGMGYYFIAITGCLIVLVVLRLIKQVFRIDRIKKIEICFIQQNQTQELLTNYFANQNIRVLQIEYFLNLNLEEPLSKDIYTLNIPDNLTTGKVISDIADIDNIKQVATLQSDVA
ncbi:MgtC/SapB family protein [Lacticigenium naphthae]|uniref:MgtC/SapB family protein n=1 Tax=Lacticigenium naphthae TaxID=515351 RepID=UPI00040DE4DD|nr:MgtC/SapB family protein [Lacticigenium naphthae]